jgi:prepilin-type N-terminal cleavage/methylation domain-containing protein
MLKRFLSKILGNQNGFTLIEMIVVVGIISLLAAAVIPNISRFIGAGDAGAKSAEENSVRHAMYSLMSEKALASVDPWDASGSKTSTNDWTNKPTVNSTIYRLYEPDREYLMEPLTQFYYCYDSLGIITRVDDGPTAC